MADFRFLRTPFFLVHPVYSPYQAGIFTLGCFYRNQEVKFMSNMTMHGSVTDAQVFSRELSTEEMVDITSCRSVAVCVGND